MKKTLSFSSAKVSFYINDTIQRLPSIAAEDTSIIITDEHVFARHKNKIRGYRAIVIPPGEEHKVQHTADFIITELVEAGADRGTTLIGLGGGVVTDITGYVAGIFMRGVSFGFVPTTVLAMVDAAIGGKNGIDVGLYKNLVGLVRQPSFILYDNQLLKTLPQAEWVNGFAEIIKHSCIADRKLFSQLQSHSLKHFQKDETALSKLIAKNIAIKTSIVQRDEFEQGERRLLNFGHTFGHAIENLYNIPHGHAVSIGMGIACKISGRISGFSQTAEVMQLLKQYGLPPQFQFDASATLKVLEADKKKQGTSIRFILLQQIGKAFIQTLSFDELETITRETLQEE